MKANHQFPKSTIDLYSRTHAFQRFAPNTMVGLDYRPLYSRMVIMQSLGGSIPTCTRSSKSAPPKALLQKRAREVTCLKAPAHTTPQCIARIPQIRAELGGRVRGRGRGAGAHAQQQASRQQPRCARTCDAWQPRCDARAGSSD